MRCCASRLGRLDLMAEARAEPRGLGRGLAIGELSIALARCDRDTVVSSNALRDLVLLHVTHSDSCRAVLSAANHLREGVAELRVRRVLQPSDGAIAELLGDNAVPCFRLKDDVRATGSGRSLGPFHILSDLHQAVMLTQAPAPPLADAVRRRATADREDGADGILAIILLDRAYLQISEAVDAESHAVLCAPVKDRGRCMQRPAEHVRMRLEIGPRCQAAALHKAWVNCHRSLQ
mmetsp:Transcript_55837/g.141395  ORF Transcript_55837/g.141395 Transcript_55837/m.141395 type:complete len:235 (+) Transcript_55837:48-752(+)